MDNYETLQDYICDTWLEIDHLLRGGGDQEPVNLEMWMNILGVFQSKADAFDIDRSMIGLPTLDADQLYIEYLKGT
jgi:hypothetical protein